MAEEKRPRGRPRFVPSEGDRKTVRTLARYGVPYENIASVVGISDRTLSKAFRAELDLGKSEANAAVMQTCFQMATSGRHPAATFFWLKCQAGWREQPRDSRWADDQREPSAPKVGKKEQAQADADATVHGISADWGDDLNPNFGRRLN